MTTKSFAVTWDYRCPFARNAHEHLVTGLKAGADWDVQFLPFSLDQSHVAEGDPPVWDEPDRYPALLAAEAGVVVRDRYPAQFLSVHEALFGARHEHSRDLRERAVVGEILAASGVDAPSVFEAIDDGWPLDTVRKEHEAAAGDLQVFGVPTFIIGDRAVFVRLLSRPEGDADLAIKTVNRVVGLIDDSPELNEFKYTTIPN